MKAASVCVYSMCVRARPPWQLKHTVKDKNERAESRACDIIYHGGHLCFDPHEPAFYQLMKAAVGLALCHNQGSKIAQE